MEVKPKFGWFDPFYPLLVDLTPTCIHKKQHGKYYRYLTPSIVDLLGSDRSYLSLLAVFGQNKGPFMLFFCPLLLSRQPCINITVQTLNSRNHRGRTDQYFHFLLVKGGTKMHFISSPEILGPLSLSQITATNSTQGVLSHFDWITLKQNDSVFSSVIAERLAAPGLTE